MKAHLSLFPSYGHGSVQSEGKFERAILFSQLTDTDLSSQKESLNGPSPFFQPADTDLTGLKWLAYDFPHEFRILYKITHHVQGAATQSCVVPPVLLFYLKLGGHLSCDQTCYFTYFCSTVRNSAGRSDHFFKITAYRICRSRFIQIHTENTGVFQDWAQFFFHISVKSQMKVCHAGADHIQQRTLSETGTEQRISPFFTDNSSPL